MHPTDKAARVAGAVYLSLVLTGSFSLLYVPGRLIVRGNAAATAGNILAHQTLFRLGIVGNLLGSVIFICVGIALYRLLSSVNRTHAFVMMTFVLVSSTVSFLNELNNIGALLLFRGEEFLTVMDKAQLEALGMLFIRLHGQGIVINEIFWGLWLLPFGLLVWSSGFLPRILGALLIVGCFTWLTVSLTSLLQSSYANVVARAATLPEAAAELPIMLWLLIKGAKVRTGWPSQSPAVAAPS
jgi:hypothetical protein